MKIRIGKFRIQSNKTVTNIQGTYDEIEYIIKKASEPLKEAI